MRSRWLWLVIVFRFWCSLLLVGGEGSFVVGRRGVDFDIVIDGIDG